MQPPSARLQFTLSKYSRALTPAKINQGSGSRAGNEFDWQQYSEPTIRLCLLTSTSSNGSIEGMKLVVTWLTGDSIKYSGNVSTGLVFEDVDIMAFKRMMPISQQITPIKAVYRDNIVGFRYIKSVAPLEYHRFQVTFGTSEEANQLIRAIRDVCPCKSNSTNIPSRVPTAYNVPLPLNHASDPLSISASGIYQRLAPRSSQCFNTPAATNPHVSIPETPRRLGTDSERSSTNSRNYVTPCRPRVEMEMHCSSQASSQIDASLLPSSQEVQRHLPLDSRAGACVSYLVPVNASLEVPQNSQSIEQAQVMSSSISPQHHFVQPATDSDSLLVESLRRSFLQSQASFDPIFSQPLATEYVPQPTLTQDYAMHVRSGNSQVNGSHLSEARAKSALSEGIMPSLTDEELETLVTHVVNSDSFPQLLEQLGRLYGAKGLDVV